ncbi:MAG: ribonuclease P protein component [Gammaproteobacteria bacterium]|nr:ribonuclease P protein component [Gammaproteobacteria bacterium]NNJ84159.1 ribonuclease P protein component [Gammaproteobacteria bacterium]
MVFTKSIIEGRCRARYGFPCCLRLRRKRDYARVFDDPYRSTDSAVTVLGRPNGRDIPRLGLAISKRWLPRAVSRNRIKRLIRESFRAHRRQLQGMDVVVISRSAIANIESIDFSRSLERHWKRMGNPIRRSRNQNTPQKISGDKKPCDAS